MSPEYVAQQQAEFDAYVAALSPEERAAFDEGMASLRRVMDSFAEWYGGMFKVAETPRDPDES